MFKFFKERRELILSENIDTAGKIFIQAIGLIGKLKITDRLNNGNMLIVGKTSYGFQSVPMTMTLVRNDAAQTVVTILAECDDVQGEAAKQSMSRLLRVYDTIYAGDASAIDQMMKTDALTAGTGVSKKRMAFLFFVIFLIVAAGSLIARVWVSKMTISNGQ